MKERKDIKVQSREPVAKDGQLPDAIDIRPMIRVIRGLYVLLDSDLSALYGVETRRLNEQVKRNITRFPEDFMFQLSKAELDNLMSQNATSSWGGTRKLPYAFANIRIMRAFVSMRRFLITNVQLFQRLEALEYHQLEMKQHQEVTDKRIDEVFKRLDANISPRQGIFYDGQIFDAYRFVSDLIREAKQSIALIDNYVDDTVFTLLDKRATGVSAIIYIPYLRYLTNGQRVYLQLSTHYVLATNCN